MVAAVHTTGRHANGVNEMVLAIPATAAGARLLIGAVQTGPATAPTLTSPGGTPVLKGTALLTGSNLWLAFYELAPTTGTTELTLTAGEMIWPGLGLYVDEMPPGTYLWDKLAHNASATATTRPAGPTATLSGPDSYALALMATNDLWSGVLSLTNGFGVFPPQSGPLRSGFGHKSIAASNAAVSTTFGWAGGESIEAAAIVGTWLTSSNASPIANSGANETKAISQGTVALVGTDSDPDGAITARAWSVVSAGTTGIPLGTSRIASPTSASTTLDISGLAVGTLRVRYTVTDNASTPAVTYHEHDVTLVTDVPVVVQRKSRYASGVLDFTLDIDPTAAGTRLLCQAVQLGGSAGPGLPAGVLADAVFTNGPAVWITYFTMVVPAGTESVTITAGEAMYPGLGLTVREVAGLQSDGEYDLAFTANYQAATTGPTPGTHDELEQGNNLAIAAFATDDVAYAGPLTASNGFTSLAPSSGELRLGTAEKVLSATDPLTTVFGIGATPVNAETVLMVYKGAAANQRPTVTMGPAQVATVGQTIVLAASDADIDGTVVLREWTPPPGVTLSSTTVQAPTWVTTGHTPGVYQFTYRAKDDDGAWSLYGTVEHTLVAASNPTGTWTELQVTAPAAPPTTAAIRTRVVIEGAVEGETHQVNAVDTHIGTRGYWTPGGRADDVVYEVEAEGDLNSRRAIRTAGLGGFLTVPDAEGQAGETVDYFARERLVMADGTVQVSEWSDPATVVFDLQQWTLTDPLDPSFDQQVRVRNLTKQRPNRQQVVDVAGSATPIVWDDEPSTWRGSLTILTLTPAARAVLDAKVASGQVLLLRGIVENDEPGEFMYVLLGAASEDRLARMPTPERESSWDYVQTDRP
jgi:hypothetical protein